MGHAGHMPAGVALHDACDEFLNAANDIRGLFKAGFGTGVNVSLAGIHIRARKALIGGTNLVEQRGDLHAEIPVAATDFPGGLAGPQQGAAEERAKLVAP